MTATDDLRALGNQLDEAAAVVPAYARWAAL
jgi:hypothetical protein